jgi:hypothetical protein
MLFLQGLAQLIGLLNARTGDSIKKEIQKEAEIL